MTAHLGGPETEEQLAGRHERYLRLSQSGNDRVFAIVLEPEGTAVGWIGFWESEWDGEALWEAGWAVLPEYQGRGIATRALLLALEEARTAGLHRTIQAMSAVDNGASNAVCRKAGFTLLGEVTFDYPPGQFRQWYNWRLDLLAGEGDGEVTHMDV